MKNIRQLAKTESVHIFKKIISSELNLQQNQVSRTCPQLDDLRHFLRGKFRYFIKKNSNDHSLMRTKRLWVQSIHWDLSRRSFLPIGQRGCPRALMIGRDPPSVAFFFGWKLMVEALDFFFSRIISICHRSRIDRRTLTPIGRECWSMIKESSAGTPIDVR